MIFMEKDVFPAKPKQEENQIHKLLRLSAFSKEVRKKKDPLQDLQPKGSYRRIPGHVQSH